MKDLDRIQILVSNPFYEGFNKPDNMGEAMILKMPSRCDM
jgi:hypothetical protein